MRFHLMNTNPLNLFNYTGCFKNGKMFITFDIAKINTIDRMSLCNTNMTQLMIERKATHLNLVLFQRHAKALLARKVIFQLTVPIWVDFPLETGLFNIQITWPGQRQNDDYLSGVMWVMSQFRQFRNIYILTSNIYQDSGQ